jgi:hypothetical protein
LYICKIIFKAIKFLTNKKMITNGKFKDGTIGWKVDNRETNGVKGFEIHCSDDGECVTDHVYERSDADLIAAAPELLIACENALRDIYKLNAQLIAEGKHGYILMENELNSAINKAYGDVV